MVEGGAAGAAFWRGGAHIHSATKAALWDEGVGGLERETFDAFLKRPAPQRKIIREVTLTFAKVHSTTDLPTPPPA